MRAAGAMPVPDQSYGMKQHPENEAAIRRVPCGRLGDDAGRGGGASTVSVGGGCAGTVDTTADSLRLGRLPWIRRPGCRRTGEYPWDPCRNLSSRKTEKSPQGFKRPPKPP